MGAPKVIDVKDSEVIEFVKSKWLQMGFAANKEDEIRTSVALDDLFSTYSQCFQLPDLIEKLIFALREVIAESSGGVFFTGGHVPTSLLMTFSACVRQLPNQHNFRIWQLFLDESKHFFSADDPTFSLQAGSLILAQFFASFMCHMNIIELMSFSSHRQKIQSLVQQTDLFVHSNAQVFGLNNDNYQVAHLILVIAFRKLRSAYNFSLDDNSADHLVDSCCGFEFLPDHATGCYNFMPYLESHDQRISYCMVQLLLERMLSLMASHEYEPTGKSKKPLKDIMRVVTAHTVSAMLSGEDCFWDMNINSLDAASYKVAVVTSYVSQLPRFLSYVDSVELAEFCFALIKVTCQPQIEFSSPKQGTTMHGAILGLLSSEFFKESLLLQSAFTTGVWRYAKSILMLNNNCGSSLACNVMAELCSSPSLWVKYAETTTKVGEAPNSMWVSISEISRHMVSLLSDLNTAMAAFREPEHLPLIQVVSYLPLEYLAPGNQMRCLIGLSLSILILDDSLKACSDRAGNAAEILQSMDCAFEAIVAILDGVRSVWLFDFVDSKVYLPAVIAIVDHMRNMDKSRSFQWLKPLLIHLMNLSTRNAESLLGFQEFLPKLFEEMTHSLTAAEALLCLFHRLTQLLERAYLKPDFKQSCENLVALSCSKIHKYMKHYQSEEVSQTFACFVGCYSSLVRLVANPSIAAHQPDQRTKWLKWVPNVVDIILGNIGTITVESDAEVFYDFVCEVVKRKDALPGSIPENIASKCWNSFKGLFCKKCEQARTLFQKALKKYGASPSASHAACLKLFERLQVDQDEESNDAEVDVIFSDIEHKAIISVLGGTSDKEFDCIVNEILAEMGEGIPNINEIDVFNYQIVLKISEFLCTAAEGENKLNIASRFVPQMLMKVILIMNQACSSPACLLTFVLPSLNFVSLVLGKKMKKVSLPKSCVSQCLHSCLTVDLAACVEIPKLFTSAHQAVLRVLSLLLSSHLHVILPCRIALIPCITNLLKSVIWAGNQELMLTWEEDIQSEIVLCARNLEGLFAAMSQNEKEFGKMVPYIIADYVDFIQNVTLHPSMKPTLMAAMSRLLAMCSKESLSMLSVNVSHTCREIYQGLLRNYKSGRFVGEV